MSGIGYGKRADLLTQKLQSCDKRAKLEHCHPNGTNHTPYCRLIALCQDKQFKKTRVYGRTRRYQLCGFSGTCNQQTTTPAYYEI